MNKDKQIEEMAKITCLCNACGICECDKEPCDLDCSEGKAMERLYNAGYRKASEVAREIFAEIERLMLDGEIGGKYPAKVINPDKYGELKEKYIGEDTNVLAKTFAGISSLGFNGSSPKISEANTAETK